MFISVPTLARLVRPLPFALVVLVLVPAASAVAPLLPGDGTEPILWQQRYSYATSRSCGSGDPVVGAVSTDLTSSIAREVEGALTRYAIHLDAVLGDAACPAVDLALRSEAAWPTLPNQQTYGSILMDCGATGSVMFYRYHEAFSIHLFWSLVPDACGLPFSSDTVVVFGVQPAQPAPTLVCSPVIFAGCTGAIEHSYAMPSCTDERLDVRAGGFTVAQGAHSCHWSTGKEYAFVGDGIGLVGIRATHDSCTIELLSSFSPSTQSCPAEVGDALMGVDWHSILP